LLITSLYSINANRSVLRPANETSKRWSYRRTLLSLLTGGYLSSAPARLLSLQDQDNSEAQQRFSNEKRFHMENKVHRGVAEDAFTGAIESQTSRIPSSGYLAAAFGAIATSAILKLAGKDDWALFVGQWPAAFMLMGVYNKMVKQHGSDAYSGAA
jgi:hypothetical protein